MDRFLLEVLTQILRNQAVVMGQLWRLGMSLEDIDATSATITDTNNLIERCEHQYG